MKKIIMLICVSALLVSMVSCGQAKVDKTMKITGQKEVARIARYDSEIPKDYAWFDYKETAIGYDKLVFEGEQSGAYLPLMWQDNTHSTFGFPAYVGDGRFGADGSQEAVATIAAVLSATLLGIDKSDQNGINYVEQLHAYFSQAEQIVQNNPTGTSQSTSLWYLLYPAILFTQVSAYYPEETQIREDALATVESWYKAFRIMEKTGTFEYTGFNFLTMEPYENGIWKEPDCVSGIAVLMQLGYEMTGIANYMEAIPICLDYLDGYAGSPLYEVLLYFAPAMAAKMNARYGMDYNVEKLLGDVLNGNSIPRGGWGSISGVWGDYSMNGLMGSTTDGGGYAFAMNSFAGGYALSGLAKYDTRYAQAMGVWYLNLASSSRYFFASETAAENQSATLDFEALEFLEQSGGVVPYEGIRKSSNTKTPWIGGDPTVYGWAQTDLSLYSGAHTGMFAHVVERTDVEKILKINCNASETEEGFPAYLIYNPYDTEQKVTYELPEGIWDLFDSVEKKKVAESESGKIVLTLEAGQAVVLTELPGDSAIEYVAGRYMVSGQWIASDTVTAFVTSHQNNNTVKGKVNLGIEVLCTNPEAVISEVMVEIDGKERIYDCKKGEKVTFQTKEFGTGSKNVNIKVTMSDGGIDQTSLRLRFE